MPTRKPRRRKAPAPPGDAVAAARIRVRMYRVGFGDCFLVSFPRADGDAHVLVDCGVHGQGDAKTMRRAVDDIATLTGRHLHLVVATHAHQDHLSGFAACAEVFRTFTVDEVWLPWTEDPDDAQAAGYKRKQLALFQKLQLHFAALAAAGDPDAQSERRRAALAALQNLSGNEKALALLKSGFGGGRVRYLEAGASMADVADVPGLGVRVLGPPRDEKFLGKMDPTGAARWLRVGAEGAVEEAESTAPFPGRKWRVSEADEQGDRRWQFGRRRDTCASLLGPALRAYVEGLVDGAEGLAFQLDHAVNNSSVVTLFSFRGQHLLFPGDAQAGNWAAWIDDPDGIEILRDVTFLKVAHHGSHNATPRTVVERMSKGAFAAMVATQSTPWASIPLPELMDALDSKATAVVRSDRLHVDAKNAPDGPDVGKPLPKGFSAGDIWIDYTLDL